MTVQSYMSTPLLAWLYYGTLEPLRNKSIQCLHPFDPSFTPQLLSSAFAPVAVSVLLQRRSSQSTNPELTHCLLQFPPACVPELIEWSHTAQFFIHPNACLVSKAVRVSICCSSEHVCPMKHRTLAVDHHLRCETHYPNCSYRCDDGGHVLFRHVVPPCSHTTPFHVSYLSLTQECCCRGKLHSTRP